MVGERDRKSPSSQNPNATAKGKKDLEMVRLCDQSLSVADVSFSSLSRRSVIADLKSWHTFLPLDLLHRRFNPPVAKRSISEDVGNALTLSLQYKYLRGSIRTRNLLPIHGAMHVAFTNKLIDFSVDSIWTLDISLTQDKRRLTSI